MSKEIQRSDDESERTELPIERGFPIERVNEIAEKEGRAGMHYRPIYTMHKWWARRLGCVFRTIALYSLVDDADKVTIRHPGTGEEATLEELGLGEFDSLQDVIDNVSQADSEALWNLYTKDVTVEGKKVLDPFMGGGTSVVEASRFGAEVLGNDLNPVAWFVTKKEIEAGGTDVAELEAGFEQVKEAVAEEIKSYYKTPCPHGDHDADAMYYFWTKELDCVGCGETVSLFNDYRIGKARYDEQEHGDYNVLCPECESIVLVDGWQSECSCSECGHGFVPKDGTVSGGNYSCRSCGQKYGITDAIQEQDGFDMRLYAVEWFCPTCDDHKGMSRGDVKGYKPTGQADLSLFNQAKQTLEELPELEEYIPAGKIREGHKTKECINHGITHWRDMYNERQLLCLSILLKSIDNVENDNITEYLLLAFSESLKFNSLLTSYQSSNNHSNHVFKTNSLDSPDRPNEGNIWGTEYGMGSFTKTYSLVKKGVKYGSSPTERYIDGQGNTSETENFDTPIGENTSLVAVICVIWKQRTNLAR